ncbi:MAG: TIGR00730 family Rossman fold protein [Alphaproteobacteria bacterium]|nr:TIGR00730 family Rossman fold protein [Alphaproteobacteria bacterium]
MATTLCVYCGGSDQTDDIYRQAAVNLGTLMAQNKLGLVFGGGKKGLMGRVADAVVKNGGLATGIITHLLVDKEGISPDLNHVEIVDTMHERKLKMSELADVFIILPGGFGTLDELFEIVTWRQLNIHTKPIIILNINNYWTPLVALMQQVFDHKFAPAAHLELVTVVDNPQQAIDLVIKSMGC